MQIQTLTLCQHTITAVTPFLLRVNMTLILQPSCFALSQLTARNTLIDPPLLPLLSVIDSRMGR